MVDTMAETQMNDAMEHRQRERTMSPDDSPFRRIPQQARGQQRIERLLDAAEQVFGEVGYDAATTNAIAARANTSIGSLYQFFPNKEAVLHALAARQLRLLSETLDCELTPETASLPLGEFLDRILGAIAQFQANHAGFHPLFTGAHTSVDLAHAAYDLRQAVAQRIDGLLALRAPTLDPRDRLLYAQVCVNAVAALLPLAQKAPGAERARVVAEIKRLLLAYLSPVLGDDDSAD